jgi:hypothetical protein
MSLLVKCANFLLPIRARLKATASWPPCMSSKIFVAAILHQLALPLDVERILVALGGVHANPVTVALAVHVLHDAGIHPLTFRSGQNHKQRESRLVLPVVLPTGPIRRYALPGDGALVPRPHQLAVAAATNTRVKQLAPSQVRILKGWMTLQVV